MTVCGVGSVEHEFFEKIANRFPHLEYLGRYNLVLPRDEQKLENIDDLPAIIFPHVNSLILRC